MRRSAPLCVLLLALGASALPSTARAITRDQVLARAKATCNHPWSCSTANLTGSCGSTYKSVYIVGDYVGLPYDWGGYMTLFEFDQKIAKGYGAGSYSADGILECTVGLDCSGFVSKCWDAAHYSTSTLSAISTAISLSQILPGDCYNLAGTHVILHGATLGSGDPVFYESSGYNTHVNVSGGWSYVSGYTPRRYNSITGTSTTSPSGTSTNPIVLSSFPASDSGDTSTSSSDVLDGCAASASTSESGPEVIYKVTLSQPGTLTASVSDDVGVDVDVHLYTSLNTNDCIARADSTLTETVDCGTYYIVVDTYADSSGKEYPGAYTLTASFTASGASCGSGPATYAPKGAMGDACAYSGNKNLPFCNENLGSETCIYSTTKKASFCSKPCTTASDCTAFSGGCCEDLGQGESYCLLASWCSASPKEAGASSDAQALDGRPGEHRAREGSLLDAARPIGEAGDGDGLEPAGAGGCGCDLASRRKGGGAWALLALALLARRALRERGRRSA
jgi:hypothetical protein